MVMFRFGLFLRLVENIDFSNRIVLGKMRDRVDPKPLSSASEIKFGTHLTAALFPCALMFPF